MRRLGNIEEILRIFTPKLVFLSFLIYPTTTCSIGIPFTLEWLLNGLLELCELDLLFGREDTKIEWSLTFLLVRDLRVRNNHVMHRLLLVLRS